LFFSENLTLSSLSHKDPQVGKLTKKFAHTKFYESLHCS